MASDTATQGNHAVCEVRPGAAAPAAVAQGATGPAAIELRLAGDWKLGKSTSQADRPSVETVLTQLRSMAGLRRVAFDAKDLAGWDSGLLTFLARIEEHCLSRDVEVDRSGLPHGVGRLLALATAVPEREGVRKTTAREPFLARVGDAALGWGKGTLEVLEFLGEAFVAVLKLFVGRARYRRSDFWLFVEQCGADAVPIVSLISFLVGLILAFIAVIQLAMFGAQIYVANLVGIAMTRVLGAVMAGVIMAGRTGAAFAAQLGTMQVNEEIDALKTMGISPMEFLVLPRMLALTLMMPLICLYSDLMGILGGMAVGIGMLDLNFAEYLRQTQTAVKLNHIGVGLLHSAVFGVLVSLSGCLRGMQTGRSSAAVGAAATSAVVTSIVSLVVATAIITALCNVLTI